jgi:hypothetical protein
MDLQVVVVDLDQFFFLYNQNGFKVNDVFDIEILSIMISNVNGVHDIEVLSIMVSS